jgi:hypothetical protein
MTRLYLLAFLFLTMSCAQDDPGTDIEDPFADNFIKSKVDGLEINCSYRAPGFDKTFSGFEEEEQLVHIQRLKSSAGQEGYQIELENIDLDAVTYPESLRFDSLASNPRLRFFYYTPTGKVYGQQATDPTKFSLTIDNWDDDDLTGVFSGVLNASQNDSIRVTNGQFLVHIKRF